jgi:hypothetical protein
MTRAPASAAIKAAHKAALPPPTTKTSVSGASKEEGEEGYDMMAVIFLPLHCVRKVKYPARLMRLTHQSITGF